MHPMTLRIQGRRQCPRDLSMQDSPREVAQPETEIAAKAQKAAKRHHFYKGRRLTWLWEPGKCCQKQTPCQSLPCAAGLQIEPGDLKHGTSMLRWWHHRCVVEDCSRCLKMNTWASRACCWRGAGQPCWRGSKAWPGVWLDSVMSRRRQDACLDILARIGLPPPSRLCCTGTEPTASASAGGQQGASEQEEMADICGHVYRSLVQHLFQQCKQ